MYTHPGGANAVLNLIGRASLAPGAKVIDLGAGDGDAVRLLRALGYEANGVDITPGEDVDSGDLFNLDCELGSFDAVLSQCTFLLTGDVPGAMAAAGRILRPGGILLYSDAVPGGEEALRLLAGAAGFEPVSVEDETDGWREYIITALWKGDAELPEACKNVRNVRYLSAILRKL